MEWPGRHGQHYAYRIGNDPREYPDPVSRWQPKGVHRASAVFDPARFLWSDAGWRGVASETLSIYELHVGTFTPEGTFAAVADRLPELRELGITAIELMPIAQFSGSVTGVTTASIPSPPKIATADRKAYNSWSTRPIASASA